MANPEMQVIALGCGMEPDGSTTPATRQRALLTAQYVAANYTQVASVDFSGKYSVYGEVPVSGTEADCMNAVAEEVGMPRAGIRIDLDRDPDDTVGNFVSGIRKGYLDTGLETHIVTHRDHMPRSRFLGSLAMPRARLIPVQVSTGNSAATAAKERVLLAGYRHVMRHVRPGDLDGIDAANEIMRRAALSVLNPDAMSEHPSLRAKLGFMWDLVRGEG